MASAPAIEPLKEVARDDAIWVRTDQIDIAEEDRLRPIDRAWAAALGKMIIKDGQDTDITVCRLPGSDRWRLVAGAHRVVGCQIEEVEMMRATVVGPNALDRRRRETAENLHRKDLEPFERAGHVAELVSVLKLKAGIDPTKDGRTASANARWQKAVAEEVDDAKLTMSLAYGWTDQVRATGKEIEKALTGIAQDRFGGMMDRQSRTLAGLWSNLKDQIAGFQLEIADAGFYDVVKGKLQRLLDWMSQAAKDGSLERWAKRVSDELSTMTERAWQFINGTDWAAVISGVAAVAGAFINVASAIGKAVGAIQRWNLESERAMAVNTRDGWFTSPQQRVAAERRIRQIDERLTGKPGRLFDRSGGERAADQAAMDRAASRGARRNPSTWTRPAPEMLRRPVPAPFQRGRGSVKTSAAEPIDGKVQVEVTVKPDGGARVQKVASNDTRVPVTVKTGKAMAGAA